MRSRIWAETVTSSPVVGSSARQQLWAASDGNGNDDSLLHTAGELVRIPPQALFRLGQPDGAQEGDGRLLGVVTGHGEVVAERFGNLPTDSNDRIESRRRVLEDHGDLGAPQAAQLVDRCLRKVHVSRIGRGLADDSLRREQTHDRLRQDALAGTGFADDGKCAAALEVEGDAVDRSMTRPWPVWKYVFTPSTWSSGRSSRSSISPDVAFRAHITPCRLSRTLRSRSPMKFTGRMNENIATAGAMSSIGSWAMLLEPSAIMFPQVAVGLGTD